MLDGLYWEYLYNDGTDKRFICPGGEEAVGQCFMQWKFLLKEKDKSRKI